MKKISNIIFCLIFLLMLAVPFVLTNFEKNVISEIDNEYLPELDTASVDSFVKTAGNYLDKRIGFRGETLELYQQINDKLFAEMEHPIHMYGKEGHMFYKAELYINDYQHLNLDAEWADGFAKGMKSFQSYAESKDITFLYMLIPDKKTVYSEYFPDGYNVLGDVSRTDQVLSALDKYNVNYYWAKDTMLKGKESMLVNNKKYDITHWNENGAFIVLKELIEKLRVSHPELTSLSIDDFDVSHEIKEKLANSDFVINEKVPLYTPKEDNAVLDRGWMTEHGTVFPEGDKVHYFSYHHNPENKDKPRILVIHDSYLGEKEKFFTGTFSEVFFLHRYNIYNLEMFEYYTDHIKPDIIIYENPERSWPIDLYKEYTLNQ